MTKVRREYLHGPNPPISLNSTYYKGQRSVYGRETNPTWEYLEDEIGALEGGLCTVFASGMGAIASIVATLSASQHLYLASDAYNGTRRLSEYLARAGRVAMTYVTPEEIREASFLKGAKKGDLFFFESPSNPELNIYDIFEIASACKKSGLMVVIDNTFATPILQNPLSLGVDVVVHSLTKAISGHSDVLGGAVVVRDENLHDDFRLRRSLLGAIPSSQDVFLILRGLKTLELRMGRATENATKAFELFHERMSSSSLHYPFHPDSPEFKVAKAQMKGGGAMLSVVFDGATQADGFIEALKVFHKATSLGGVESLVERRALRDGEENTHPGLVRLSFGIEHWNDLERDLIEALNSIGL